MIDPGFPPRRPRASRTWHRRAIRNRPSSLSPAMPNRRPQLEIVAPSASPEDAAAVVPALERFMRETAPTPAAAQPRPHPRPRTPPLEGVDRDPPGPTASRGG